MWFFKIIESFIKREKNEAGSGLMTVLGVSLIVTIAASTITTSIIFASNFTSSQLSKEQADESADAGIADAINKFSLNTCENTGTSSETIDGRPKYKYHVYRGTGQAMPKTTSASSVYPGCPGDNESQANRWMLIEAYGYGSNKASTKKTAVYKVMPENMSVIPQAITGSAIQFTNGSRLKKEPGVVGGAPSVYTAYATICGYSTSLGDGTDTENIINGNVKSKTTINYSDLYNPSNPETRPCTINGNMDTYINNSNVTAFNINDTTVSGNFCANKTTPRTNAKNVKGRLINRSTSSITCDYKGSFYNYKPDLTDSVKFSGTECSKWDTFRSKVIGQTADYSILDLTGCKNIDLSNMFNTPDVNEDLPIKSNVTLVINPDNDYKNGFKINNLTIKSGISGENLNFNIVFPPSQSNAGSEDMPEPAADENYNYLEIDKMNYSSGSSGIIYSSYGMFPIENSNIIGQIYTNGIPILVNTTLSYMPVGLPDAEKKIKDIGKAKDLIRVY